VGKFAGYVIPPIVETGCGTVLNGAGVSGYETGCNAGIIGERGAAGLGKGMFSSGLGVGNGRKVDRGASGSVETGGVEGRGTVNVVAG